MGDAGGSPSCDGDDERCRVALGSWIHGEGETLQDAADDLVDRLVVLARSLHASGVRSVVSATDPRRDALTLLWRLGQRVTRHDDEHELVFGAAGPQFSV